MSIWPNARGVLYFIFSKYQDYLSIIPNIKEYLSNTLNIMTISVNFSIIYYIGIKVLLYRSYCGYYFIEV